MQRIQPKTNPEGKAAELLEGVKKTLGSTPNMFTTFANSPAALEGYLNFSGALSRGRLNGQLRESLALVAAGFNGCDYCASAHSFLGDRAGIEQSELQANLEGKSSDSKTQSALTFATTLLETRGHPSEEDLTLIRNAGFSEEEIIEILAHVSLNIFTNYFNESFGVEVDFPKHVSATGNRRVA